MGIADRTPVQVAWVTRDLDATERALTTLLGAKKWVRIPGVRFGPDTATVRGEPADFVADISLSYAGDMQLEVIAPVSGDSPYSEFLDACGPGLHHICLETDDLSETLADVGGDVVARATMAGGMEFAYVSALDAGVPFIEYACISSDIRSFFDHVKQEQQ